MSPLAPLLLLCLLLLVNGCTSKPPTTDPQDLTAELEALQQREKKKKEQKVKEADDEQQEELEQHGNQQKERQKKKKRKKIPGTQRPYVIEGQTYHPISSAEGYEETGLASWYGDPFHGRKTANGETYDMYGVTAAHKTLPMDTMLLVKNLANGKATTVRINDRGPFVDGRIIDLSYTTAKELGIVHHGTEQVQIIALCAAEEQGAEPQEVVGQFDQKNDKASTEEWGGEEGLTVLAAQVKKKKTQKTERVTGSMCVVIRPDSKKKRIHHDFDKGNFYIQVGSFEEKVKARELARTFAVKGRDVVIQEFAAAGASLFRVLVFSSTSLKEAKKHNDKLKKQGYAHAFVIARDTPPKK
ncbi:MAG: septal ring lytic transglycosylase RlpA family protein, partial [Candidatus Electrothrix sp.]